MRHISESLRYAFRCDILRRRPCPWTVLVVCASEIDDAAFFYFVIYRYDCSIWTHMGDCLRFGQIWPRQRFEYHDRNAGHLITRLLEHKYGMREKRAVTFKFPYFIYSIAYCTFRVSHQDTGEEHLRTGRGQEGKASCSLPVKSCELTESIEAKAEACCSNGRLFSSDGSQWQWEVGYH